ncbi:MAG: JDVT-CTERM domain-containing protein [Betaproteobacteria bacterium]
MPAFAAPGEFDPAFGQNGIATVPTTGRSVANFVTTDGAGRVLATGLAAPASVGNEGFGQLEFIARMLANGNQDPSFNGSGAILSPPTPVSESGALYFGHQGMSLLPAAGGWLAIRAEDWYCPFPVVCSANYLPKITGRKFNNEGSIDPFYGPALLGSGNSAAQLLPDPDGGVTMISTGPEGFQGTSHNTTVQRITANGQPDKNFNEAMSGTLGCRLLAEEDGRRSSAKMLRLSDGKLLLAQGIELNPNAAFRLRVPTPSPHRVCISRFNADGTVDASYANNGDLLLDSLIFTFAQNAPVALLPLPSGGAALVIQKTYPPANGSGSAYLIVWLNADGVLDASRNFGQGYAGLTSLHVAVVTAAAIQPDGKIILAGYPDSRPGTNPQQIDYSQPVVGRLHQLGGNDLTFGIGRQGFIPLISFGKRLIPNHLHIADDGSIFVAGAVANGAHVPNEFTQFAVGKLQGDPLPVAPVPSQGGGGGCGITRDSRIDPTLPGLVLLAFLAFGTRRWRGGQRANSSTDGPFQAQTS